MFNRIFWNCLLLNTLRGVWHCYIMKKANPVAGIKTYDGLMSSSWPAFWYCNRMRWKIILFDNLGYHRWRELMIFVDGDNTRGIYGV